MTRQSSSGARGVDRDFRGQAVPEQSALVGDLRPDPHVPFSHQADSRIDVNQSPRKRGLLELTGQDARSVIVVDQLDTDVLSGPETSGLGQKTTIGMIQMIPRILYGGLSAVMDNLTSRVTLLNTVSFWQVVQKKKTIQGLSTAEMI